MFHVVAQNDHNAAFPDELPRRCLRMCSLPAAPAPGGAAVPAQSLVSTNKQSCGVVFVVALPFASQALCVGSVG